MCLPLLIFPCTIKSRSSLLAPAHPGGPGKRAVKRLCVCVNWSRQREQHLCRSPVVDQGRLRPSGDFSLVGGQCLEFPSML